MKFDKSTLYHVESSLSGDRHTLYDLATWKNGLAFKKIDFSATGKPVIKIAELNNGIGSNTSFTRVTTVTLLPYTGMIYCFHGRATLKHR